MSHDCAAQLKNARRFGGGSRATEGRTPTAPRRPQARLACHARRLRIDATLSVPARKMLLETTGLGPVVLRYTEIFDAQFEAKASSIKAKWGTQRRDHPELWTSPL